MCGRYSQTANAEILAKRFGTEIPPFDLAPKYNVAPSQQAPVVIEGGGRNLRLMQWGLIPSWTNKDATLGNTLINARAETVAEKPSFRKCLERRRCLALSDGFYEWARRDGIKAKVPMRFVLKSREPFAFAGLWDRWQKPDGSELRSFTIITTAANELLRPIHNRMPVLLKQEDEAKWLDPDITDAAKLTPLLVPFASEEMEAYTVSTAVNSPRVDSAECIEPVSSPT